MDHHEATHIADPGAKILSLIRDLGSSVSTLTYDQLQQRKAALQRVANEAQIAIDATDAQLKLVNQLDISVREQSQDQMEIATPPASGAQETGGADQTEPEEESHEDAMPPADKSDRSHVIGTQESVDGSKAQPSQGKRRKKNKDCSYRAPKRRKDKQVPENSLDITLEIEQGMHREISMDEQFGAEQIGPRHESEEEEMDQQGSGTWREFETNISADSNMIFGSRVGSPGGGGTNMDELSESPGQHNMRITSPAGRTSLGNSRNPTPVPAGNQAIQSSSSLTIINAEKTLGSYRKDFANFLVARTTKPHQMSIKIILDAHFAPPRKGTRYDRAATALLHAVTLFEFNKQNMESYIAIERENMNTPTAVVDDNVSSLPDWQTRSDSHVLLQDAHNLLLALSDGKNKANTKDITLWCQIITTNLQFAILGIISETLKAKHGYHDSTLKSALIASAKAQDKEYPESAARTVLTVSTRILVGLRLFGWIMVFHPGLGPSQYRDPEVGAAIKEICEELQGCLQGSPPLRAHIDQTKVVYKAIFLALIRTLHAKNHASLLERQIDAVESFIGSPNPS